MKAVWPDVHDSLHLLRRAILLLRRALGADAAAPRVVETIPTRGYRLLTPVHPCALTAREYASPRPRPGVAARLATAALVFRILAGLVPVLAQPPSNGGAPRASQAAPAAIDAVVSKMMAEAHLPGAAVAVVRHGSVVYAAGFGRSSVETGAAVTPRTGFQIGSISKPFTALAVMALVEDGRLKLDDPLSRRLADVPPGWKAITIRHLLNHTAGLWDWEAAGGLSFDREYTAREFMAIVAAHPLDFEPGTKHQYTNSGYPLLGMVVQRITGRPFEEFVRQRVFQRAGMNATAFWTRAETVGWAAGYEWKDGAWHRGMIARPRVLAPNGGIVSTVLDIARFVRALREDRIVHRATLDMMLTPPVLADGTTSQYGFGWFVQRWRDWRVIHHIGETAAGFSSSLQMFPDQDAAVIVLTNAAGVLPVYVGSRDIAAVVLE